MTIFWGELCFHFAFKTPPYKILAIREYML